jgi:hypothetical protein
MSYVALFNLKTNPFRLTPAVSPEELVWAGFPQIKAKFEGRIKRTIKIPNSSLVLNWGEYGSGKTHAARYFGKPSILQALAGQANGKTPYFMLITLPKGKSPIEDFFTSIVDKINIASLRTEFTDHREQLKEYIEKTADNLYLKEVAKAFFNPEVEENLFRRFLYGSTNSTDFKSLSEHGIQRVLSADTDYAKLLSLIFSCITIDKQHYSSVVLWIDEFEDIAILTKINNDKTNSFLRELLDNTPNNLLLFLNLTQSALFNIEDLGEYISEALKSRIKERINFEIPKEQDLLLYVRELLAAFRSEPNKQGEDPYFPFNEGLIKTIIGELGNISLRKFNESLGVLIELGEMDSKSPIDSAYYEENKTDIIGWKE